jgi:hypothetical protein
LYSVRSTNPAPFKGEDSELVEMFDKALKDVRAFALKHDRFDILMPSPQ